MGLHPEKLSSLSGLPQERLHLNLKNVIPDAAVEESKKAAEKAAADASNAVNSTVDSTLKRVEGAADEGLKNAGHVVDAKIKDADKYLNEKREMVREFFYSISTILL